LSLLRHDFFSHENIVNVLDQSSAVGIIACGETLCIIAGLFDLSVSSIAAFCGIIMIDLSNKIGLWPGVIIGLALGVTMGAINGLIVHYGRINPLIATLASGILFGGLATVFVNGMIISANHASFGVFGEVSPLDGVTVPTWLWLGVIILTWILLSGTTFGRSLFALGGNPQAARLSGLRISFIRISVYAISGGCAAIGGLIIASQTLNADPTMASGLDLTAIAAAVVGGTSISGGEGAIWRAAIGVLILTVISNGFDLLGLNSNYLLVVQGAIIIFAVGFDQLLRRRAT
jgi:ribose transport system permease protein